MIKNAVDGEQNESQSERYLAGNSNEGYKEFGFTTKSAWRQIISHNIIVFMED